jgi:hypothetical protein
MEDLGSPGLQGRRRGRADVRIGALQPDEASSKNGSLPGRERVDNYEPVIFWSKDGFEGIHLEKYLFSTTTFGVVL